MHDATIVLLAERTKLKTAAFDADAKASLLESDAAALRAEAVTARNNIGDLEDGIRLIEGKDFQFE